MRTRRMWVLLFVLGVGAARAEEVSLSRYRITAAVSSGGLQRVQPDPAVLVALCRDEDGCDAVLLSDEDGHVAMGRVRMTISTSLFAFWASSAAPGEIYANGDSVEQIVVSGSVLFSSCKFSDIDEEGTETTSDFSVTATWGGAPIACTLTLID